ncbi:MAG: hypothetical protein JWM78_3842 [Verrucomicrobiaceae bacterium]|nr:hypothetical protein [Verrucomicrobiaceae bacterium]
MRTQKLITIGVAIIVIAGIAFIANNAFYIYHHPLASTNNVQESAGGTATTTSAQRAAAPSMPQDKEHAVVYKELEERLKVIRENQRKP